MNYLIDPRNVTKFDQTQEELELFILFWVAAAGKGGPPSARAVNRLLSHWAEQMGGRPSPFEVIRFVEQYAVLADELQKFGIGCMTKKARAFSELASSGLDLRTCTFSDLKAIYNVGIKTAQCFLLHSRKDQRLAGLDTHVLAHLRDLGYDAPRSTPDTKKYRELEQIVLRLIDESGKTPAQWDLDIWNEYSQKKRNRNARNQSARTASPSRSRRRLESVSASS